MNSNTKERRTSGGSSTALTRLVSILLLIIAPGIPLLLIFHDQLNIDEDSGALAFTAFHHQPQLPVYLTYYALMAGGVLVVLLSPLLYTLYGHVQTPIRRVLLICMVVAGTALAVASTRWLVVFPSLSQIYTNPQTDATTRTALDVAYKSIMAILGTAVGEFIYNLFTSLWSLLLAMMLLRTTRGKAWFAWIGIIGGALQFLGSFEQIIENPPALFRVILIAGIVAWMIWLICFAIFLLINRSRTVAPELLVQEQEVV